jgi:hypothetical protein
MFPLLQALGSRKLNFPQTIFLLRTNLFHVLVLSSHTLILISCCRLTGDLLSPCRLPFSASTRARFFSSPICCSVVLGATVAHLPVAAALRPWIFPNAHDISQRLSSSSSSDPARRASSGGAPSLLHLPPRRAPRCLLAACLPRPPCVQPSGSPTRASLSPSPLVSMAARPSCDPVAKLLRTRLLFPLPSSLVGRRPASSQTASSPAVEWSISSVPLHVRARPDLRVPGSRSLAGEFLRARSVFSYRHPAGFLYVVPCSPCSSSVATRARRGALRAKLLPGLPWRPAQISPCSSARSPLTRFPPCRARLELPPTLCPAVACPCPNAVPLLFTAVALLARPDLPASRPAVLPFPWPAIRFPLPAESHRHGASPCAR